MVLFDGNISSGSIVTWRSFKNLLCLTQYMVSKMLISINMIAATDTIARDIASDVGFELL